MEFIGSGHALWGWCEAWICTAWIIGHHSNMVVVFDVLFFSFLYMLASYLVVLLVTGAEVEKGNNSFALRERS
jgi:hypothetical protein